MKFSDFKGSQLHYCRAFDSIFRQVSFVLYKFAHKFLGRDKTSKTNQYGKLHHNYSIAAANARSPQALISEKSLTDCLNWFEDTGWADDPDDATRCLQVWQGGGR